MFKMGSGVGNKKTARMERFEREAILERYEQRVQEQGKHPGTHTLGVEFKTRSHLLP